MPQPPFYKPAKYNPLPVSLDAAPKGIFDVQANDLTDYEKQNAALLAQQLANESNQMRVNETKRQLDDQAKLRNALAAQYGGGDVTDFNPDEALRTAQRVALQQGDLDTALSIERTQRERSGESPLTAAQMEFYQPIFGDRKIPQGITMKDLTTSSALNKANSYAQQVETQASDPNRVLNALLKQQDLTGEKIKELTPEQESTLNSFDSLSGMIDGIKQKYLPFISENRGIRFLDLTTNPNSPASRMQNELSLVTAEIAKAYNGSRLSDADIKVMAPLTQINNLDTLETVNDKLNRIKEIMNNKKISFISNLARGRVNTSGYGGPQLPLITRDLSGLLPRGAITQEAANPPSLGNYQSTPSSGQLTQEEQDYKERYKAMLRAQRGQ